MATLASSRQLSKRASEKTDSDMDDQLLPVMRSSSAFTLSETLASIAASVNAPVINITSPAPGANWQGAQHLGDLPELRINARCNDDSGTVAEDVQRATIGWLEENGRDLAGTRSCREPQLADRRFAHSLDPTTGRGSTWPGSSP